METHEPIDRSSSPPAPASDSTPPPNDQASESASEAADLAALRATIAQKQAARPAREPSLDAMRAGSGLSREGRSPPLAVSLASILAQSPPRPEPRKLTPEEARAEHKARRMREGAARLAEFRRTVHRDYAKCEFSNFEITDRQQPEAIESIKTYLRYLGRHWPCKSGVMLFGTPGTGKDHMLVAAGALAAQFLCKSVEWRNCQKLFGHWRSRIGDGTTDEEFVNRLTKADILILSDPLKLTEESLENFDRTLLYDILESRQGVSKPTWLSANVADIAELERKVGGAVADRMVNQACVLNFRWESYRRRDVDFTQ